MHYTVWVLCACMLSCSVVSDSWLLHGLQFTSSSVHGILQARILEWIAISSSRGSSQPRDWTCVFCIGRQIPYHWPTWEAHVISSICLMDEGMNAGAHTEDRVRLEVGRYLSTVRKVSLKDQLAHPGRFLRQEGLWRRGLAVRRGLGRGGDALRVLEEAHAWCWVMWGTSLLPSPDFWPPSPVASL